MFVVVTCPGFILTLPRLTTAEEIVPSGSKTISQPPLSASHLPTRNPGNRPSPSMITSTPLSFPPELRQLPSRKTDKPQIDKTNSFFIGQSPLINIKKP
jgi:hypothetical protein